MQLGSKEHKAQFIEKKKVECQENVYLNELHIMRLQDELGLLQKELARINLEIEDKRKPAANAEKKQIFVLEQNKAHKEKEILQVEEAKKYNEYLLNDLLPRYEAANKDE